MKRNPLQGFVRVSLTLTLMGVVCMFAGFCGLILCFVMSLFVMDPAFDLYSWLTLLVVSWALMRLPFFWFDPKNRLPSPSIETPSFSDRLRRMRTYGVVLLETTAAVNAAFILIGDGLLYIKFSTSENVLHTAEHLLWLLPTLAPVWLAAIHAKRRGLCIRPWVIWALALPGLLIWWSFR